MEPSKPIPCVNTDAPNLSNGMVMCLQRPSISVILKSIIRICFSSHSCLISSMFINSCPFLFLSHSIAGMCTVLRSVLPVSMQDDVIVPYFFGKFSIILLYFEILLILLISLNPAAHRITWKCIGMYLFS